MNQSLWWCFFLVVSADLLSERYGFGLCYSRFMVIICMDYGVIYIQLGHMSSGVNT
ncbi:hypothetical protein BVRB_002930 [Beta vulgaris subsp. vulgaris]|uniref:Uncharacterized protein n=1 Tax=Beta vulgaris subsp. vulgaris TaxID=3555 RepID=A0A0J8B7V0_BETVV|nr:hypothetical protein BVRB_002930 [Beta vulgaris subsp. vulgaris]